MGEEKRHGADALGTLAAQLRAEDTPIAPHVITPTVPAELGEIAAAAGASRGAEYALVVEAVYEGYLLHYGTPRLLAGHDEDLALLAGDYLYALGLDRLAALGDSRAVTRLADLIADCARLHAEGRGETAAALWRRAAGEIPSVTQVTPPKQ
jgi:hypothetical protein